MQQAGEKAVVDVYRRSFGPHFVIGPLAFEPNTMMIGKRGKRVGQWLHYRDGDGI